MIKRNVHIGFILTITSGLILLFQNCGPASNHDIPVANDRIILDHLHIIDEDCSLENSCKVTVAKIDNSSPSEEEVPTEFFDHDAKTDVYHKCVLVNRRDAVHFEYLCSK